MSATVPVRRLEGTDGGERARLNTSPGLPATGQALLDLPSDDGRVLPGMDASRP
jgi:hypothetical protein